MSTRPGPVASGGCPGKYTGSCAGAATPIALLYLGGATGYAVGHRAPSTILWGPAVFASVILPGLVSARPPGADAVPVDSPTLEDGHLALTLRAG